MTQPSVDVIYFDAVLTPNRSLSARGLMAVMLGFGAISFLCGLAFWRFGALPVAGFFGLDVLLLWLFLRRAVRRSAEETQITITRAHIRLVHRLPADRTASPNCPPALRALNRKRCPAGPRAASGSRMAIRRS